MKRGRLVERERHQAHVPAGDQLRQQRVRLLAEVVEVGAARQRGLVDLHDRADHDDLPCRVGVGDAGDEVEVEALVDDAEEAEARRGDAALQRLGARHRRAHRRSRAAPSSARASTALGRQRTFGLAVALGLVEARPAGDDEVGALQQRGLALAHLARRVLERGELVHAVVDDRARRAGRRAAAAPSACRTRRGSRRSGARRGSRAISGCSAESWSSWKPRRSTGVCGAQHLDARAAASCARGRPARRCASAPRRRRTWQWRARRDSRCCGRWKTKFPAQVGKDDEMRHLSLRDRQVGKSLLGASQAPGVAGVEPALQEGRPSGVGSDVPEPAVVPVRGVVPVGPVDRRVEAGAEHRHAGRARALELDGDVGHPARPAAADVAGLGDDEGPARSASRPSQQRRQRHPARIVARTIEPAGAHLPLAVVVVVDADEIERRRAAAELGQSLPSSMSQACHWYSAISSARHASSGAWRGGAMWMSGST